MIVNRSNPVLKHNGELVISSILKKNNSVFGIPWWYLLLFFLLCYLVSGDSTTSHDTREVDISRSGSIEGSLSVNEFRRGSRPRLAPGLSTRSFDKTLDSNAEKEPFDKDLDLDWCPECGTSLEQFDEETLNLCIVVLSTFVHQSPSMAMPFLLRMLESVARYVWG